jgi:hypothetical protein
MSRTSDTDPDPDATTRHTDWTAAIASADLEIVAGNRRLAQRHRRQRGRAVTLKTDARNNGPYGPVEAGAEGWLEAPPLHCPARLVSQQVTLQAGDPDHPSSSSRSTALEMPADV